MKTELEHFLELADQILDPKNSKSPRDITLLLGIYAEYITNWFLNNSTTKLKEVNAKNMDQDLKLKILFELGKISKEEYEVLDKLKTIRNKYAHNLDFSESDIQSLIAHMSNITLNWDDRNTESPQKLEENIRKKPFTKFLLACLCKIGYLLAKIGRMKGEKFDKTLILDIEIDGKIHKFQIM